MRTNRVGDPGRRRDEPLQLITVSDRRSTDVVRTRAWWVVPLVVAALAGGAAVGRATAPVKETIVTITLPATTIRATSTVPTVVTTVAPALAPAVLSTVVTPAATTAVPTTLVTPAGLVVMPSAVLANGTLTLQGSLPSAAIQTDILNRAAALVGADHLVNQTVLDPRSPYTSGGMIRIDEPIRFASGSLDLPAANQPIVDLVASFLVRNLSGVAVVSAYTDDEGDPLRNVGLAAQRIDAIAALWSTKGVLAEQVIRDARGGVDFLADNTTEEGRAQNRRLLISLRGLLG